MPFLNNVVTVPCCHHIILLWSNSSQPPIEAGEFLLDKVKVVEQFLSYQQVLLVSPECLSSELHQQAIVQDQVYSFS